MRAALLQASWPVAVGNGFFGVSLAGILEIKLALDLLGHVLFSDRHKQGAALSSTSYILGLGSSTKDTSS